MNKNPIHLILAMAMAMIIYPAYLANGLFGGCLAVIAMIVNLLTYFKHL